MLRQLGRLPLSRLVNTRHGMGQANPGSRAEWLYRRSMARTDAVAHQAFRIGRAGYGMQFHFEASCAVVDDWTRSFPRTILDMAPGWLDGYAKARADHGPAADAAGLALARAWVAQV